MIKLYQEARAIRSYVCGPHGLSPPVLCVMPCIEHRLKESHNARVYIVLNGGQGSAVRCVGTNELLVQEAGKKVTGDVMLYQYHPPFAPSFLRKVEVLYKLQE